MKKHKKLIIIILVVLVLLVVVWFAFLRKYVKRHFNDVEVKTSEVTTGEKVSVGDSKGIVIYFTRVGNSDFDDDVDAVASASLMKADGVLTGNSELLSKMICSATGYSSYAITTKKKYPSGYTETTQVAKEEMNSDEVVEIENVPDLSEYDTIIMVYPIWWGTIPEAVKTFFNTTDLEGKTIYSLVTHGGSGFGSTIEDTKKYTKGDVSDNNLTVYDDKVVDAIDDVTDWLKSIFD